MDRPCEDSKHMRVISMKKYHRIKQKIQHVFDNQLYGVLATSDDNQPYTSLLAFANTADLKYIFLAMGSSSYKFQNLTKNQKIAFFIDNRSNDNFDTSDAYAITAFGTASPIQNKERKDVEKIYLTRHPQLQQFIQSENNRLIKITVDSYSFVERFEDVFVVEMNYTDDPSNK